MAQNSKTLQNKLSNKSPLIKNGSADQNQKSKFIYKEMETLMSKNMQKSNYWKWDTGKNLVFYILLILFQDANASSWCCWNSVHVDESLDTTFKLHIRQKYSQITENGSLKESFSHNKENFKELRIYDDIFFILDQNPNDFWKIWHTCFEFSNRERTLLDEKIKIADLFFIMIQKMRHKKMAYAPLEKYILKIHNSVKKSDYIPQEDQDKIDQYAKTLLLFKLIDKEG